MSKQIKSESYEVIKQLFSQLSQEEKIAFKSFVNDNLDETSAKTIERALPPADKRPSACPHCGSAHFVKNGTENGKQRFRCVACRKSFCVSTGTILFHTKKDLSVWAQYIRCLIAKMSLRKCAEECGISLYTAFVWRHKILDALQNMMNDAVLDGVVQADETFTRVS